MAVGYTRAGRIMLRPIFKYSRYIIFASIFFYGVVAKVPFFQPYTVWLAQIMNKVLNILSLNAKEPVLRIMGGIVLIVAFTMAVKSIQGLTNGYFKGYSGKSAYAWAIFMLCVAFGLLVAGIYAIYMS